MSQSAPLKKLRDDAYRLHKQGELAKAVTLYSACYQRDQTNADVMGLLALCLFQLGKNNEAFLRWREALQGEVPVPLQWRNANNYFAAALSGDFGLSQKDLTSVSVQPWPQETSPTTEDINLAISLAQALEKLGRAGEIVSVFKTLAAQLDLAQPESLTFLRWALEANHIPLIEAVGVARLMKESEKIPDVKLLLAAYHFKCGNEPASSALATEVALQVPVFITPKLSEQKFIIGVLNRPPPSVQNAVDVAQFHFGENTPAGLVNRFSDAFQFVSVFPFQTAANAFRVQHRQIQFAINNWATAEILATPGTMEKITNFVNTLGLPVLNHPEAVVKTTRQQVSATLQGIDGLVVPKVLRVYNNSDAFLATALLLEREIGFPLILREPFQQMGRGAIKIISAEQLLSELRTLPFTQIYAIQYFDNPVTARIYRKIRAAIVGEEIFISHVLYGGDWNVHREKDDAVGKGLEEHPLTVGFADAITSDPISVMGSQAMENLQEVRRRIDLDLFGIDFDLMPDGRLLFFEANAAMHISFGDKYGHGDVRKKMLVALHDLFEKTSKRAV